MEEVQQEMPYAKNTAANTAFQNGNREIKVEGCAVFVDPFEEIDEQLAKEREEELSILAQEEAEKKMPKSRKEEPNLVPKSFTSGVGKYINPSTLKRHTTDDTDSNLVTAKKIVKAKWDLVTSVQ